MSSQPVDKLTPAQRSQLACTYATLILHDENSDINADKIAKLVAAAGVNVQAYWPKLIAKALQGRSVADFFGGNDSSSASVASAPAPVKQQKKKQQPAKDIGKDKKKKEQPKAPVQEDDGGMGGLFDF